jgi:hypothetical protein
MPGKQSGFGSVAFRGTIHIPCSDCLINGSRTGFTTIHLETNMAQMDEQRFAAAEQLWESGEARAAIVQHLDLVRHAHNLDVRLQSALLLVERLNPTSHDTEILECCSIGMKVAAELGDAATRIYLLGMLAKNLAIQNGSFLIARRNLRMAPGWLGFSLARDEEAYNALSSMIDANNKEIDRLTLEALEDNMDAATRGHLLLSLANVSLQRYFDVKIDSVFGACEEFPAAACQKCPTLFCSEGSL